MWIRESDCRNIVSECWNRAGVKDIMEKMVHYCVKLEEWGGGIVKELRTNLVSCRQELQKFRSRRDTVGVQQYNDVRRQYLRLLKKYEIYWKQRAKQFWLREGDKNTRFFYKYASVRKEHNKIKKLKYAQGEWKETDGDIRDVIEKYFDNLFRMTEHGDILTDMEHVCKVTNGQNQRLIMPITDDEVKAAFLCTERNRQVWMV
ncbi:uncharacterized protein LOC141663931 [Apium graveolens]|uniref:uncharacterized protein LOC141663931 n=1 Tax=Apium graveolens TaxID=4045 RepID=UPI003D78D154